MKKKTTGIIAGAAGAALLMGGGTFALWSDSAGAPGGQITSGNLAVASVGTSWIDASSDRADADHAIDLETFKIVPGDTIEGRYALDLALQGDNMVAVATLDGGGDLTGALAAGLVDVQYTIEDSEGNEVSTGNAVAAQLSLASSDNSNNDPALLTVPATLDGTADYTVVVSVTFDEATNARSLVQAQAALADATIHLSQTRAGSLGGGF